MKLSERIWRHFLADKYGLRIYQLWIDSGDVYIDVSEGLKKARTAIDPRVVDLPDHLLLPCNDNDSPSMGRKPQCYIFSEAGLDWLSRRMKKGRSWRMEQGRGLARAWWNRHAKALEKMRQVVEAEVQRLDQGRRAP